MADAPRRIGSTSAKTFAEYVHLSVVDPGSPEAPPVEKRDQTRRLQPSLVFRIHSERLRVGSNAKSLRERLLSGPTVDIYVGPSRRHWRLHHSLLAYHSEYFRVEAHEPLMKIDNSGEAAPRDVSSNDSDSTVVSELLEESLKLELLDDDPAGFELLVKWLYQGKLEDVSMIPDLQEKYEYAVACHRLYLLCDRFHMTDLKNMAMDQYRRGLNQAGLVPDSEELSEIYRLSPIQSPFRLLMTRIAARQILDPENSKDAESYRQCFACEPDFAIDLVNAIKEGTGGLLLEDPTAGDDCHYHDHENELGCPSTDNVSSALPPQKRTGSKPWASEISLRTTPTDRSRRRAPKKILPAVSKGEPLAVPTANGLLGDMLEPRKPEALSMTEIMSQKQDPQPEQLAVETPLDTSQRRAVSTTGSNSGKRRPPKLAIRDH